MRGVAIRQSVRSFDVVTLEEARAQCRVDSTDEDDLLGWIIDAVHESIEREAHRVLGDESWRVSFGDWPEGPVKLRPGPVRSVTTVQYLNQAGTWATLADSYYRLVHAGSVLERLEWVDGLVLPLLSSQCSSDRVRVTYAAGHASAAGIPVPLKAAALLLVGHYFDNREETARGQVGALPRGAEMLIGQCAYPEMLA